MDLVAVAPERAAVDDAEIRTIISSDPRAHSRIVVIGDQLIVFRDVGIDGPRCIAADDTSPDDRCPVFIDDVNPFRHWRHIHIPGTEGHVSSRPAHPQVGDCFIRQLCPGHISGRARELLAPEWQRFDPRVDSDLIAPPRFRWTPEGIRRVQSPIEPVDIETFRKTSALLATALEQRSQPVGVTALYRYYDEADGLLYIGISKTLATREGNHIKASTWMEFAMRSTIMRFPNRKGAEDAERLAIKAELPLFNVQHNDTPEARMRLVEYLCERKRLDLLAPAVSRG